MSASVAIEGLTKDFGARRAVGPVDLLVPAGECVSLLGPSGCGKTTTLRMIAGLEEPTAGRIVIGGTAVTERPAERRGVGMVFQSYALFPHLNVFENVAFGLRIRKTAAAEIAGRVERALALVGLGDYGARMPAQISGGEQQRVALARALVIEPAVLLLDEPLSNLDLKLREQMRTEIRRLQQALRITCIYVTHDQGEAMAVSDRIAIMHRGLIAQVGTPRDIYHAPASLFVAGFIGQCTVLPGVLENTQPPRFVTARGTAFAVASTRVPPGWSRGRPATLVVRPEDIEIADRASGDPGSAVNRLSGTVEEAVYLGEDVRVLVRVGGGDVLQLNMRSRRDDDGIRPGQAVAVRVAPEDCTLLEPEERG